jgi:hypothetical protein
LRFGSLDEYSVKIAPDGLGDCSVGRSPGAFVFVRVQQRPDRFELLSIQQNFPKLLLRELLPNVFLREAERRDGSAGVVLILP